jgi:hypothetical protein
MHAADLGPCCKRANKAYNAADTEPKKTAVQDKMNQWVLDNKNYFECRGYGESVKCADALIASTCNDATPQQSPDSSADGTKQNATTTPDTGTRTAGAGQQSQGAPGAENLSEVTLAEDVPAYDPKLCCAGLKDYSRKQGLRRDAYCGAQKPLTYCPFPV